MTHKKPTVKITRQAVKLFTENIAFATAVAKSLAKKLPCSIDLDEIIQMGRVGLMEAASRFNASAGVSFCTFAEMRVRGAILDFLREIDTVPRLVRVRQKKRQKAEQDLLQAGETTTPEAVKEALGWNDAEYRDSIPKLSRHIGSMVTEEEDKEYQFEAAATGEDEITNIERQDSVRGLFRHLPTETFVAIYLYYWRGARMRDIGVILGLSESRISQMQKQGLARLGEVGEKLRDHF